MRTSVFFLTLTMCLAGCSLEASTSDGSKAAYVFHKPSTAVKAYFDLSKEPVEPSTVAAAPDFHFTRSSDLAPFSMQSELHALTPLVPRFPAINQRRSSSQERTPDVNVGTDGAGYRGPEVTNETTYAGDYADQTAYTTLEPPGTLYAPTMRAPGYGCTEITTFYQSAAPEVGIWDFCINGNDHFDVAVTINSTFASKYVRSIDGLNRYTVENEFLAADGEWAAIIYNYSTKLWEKLYESTSSTCYTPSGYIACGYSWSWFEPHYNSGVICSTLPSISSSEYQEESSSKSIYVTPSISSLATGGDCWSGSNPWVFTLNQPNYQWTVTGGS